MVSICYVFYWVEKKVLLMKNNQIYNWYCIKSGIANHYVAGPPVTTN